MATLRKLYSVRKFSSSQILAGKPYRPTPIIPHVHEGGYEMWRKISFVMLPLVVLMVVKCFGFPEKRRRPDFVRWEHLRLRNKRFAWGDGNHSFFHNKHLNPLPDGYEDDDEDDCND